jgi:hypothetical protein
MEQKEKNEIRLRLMLNLLAHASLKEPALFNKWYIQKQNEYNKNKYSDELFNEVDTFFRENADVIQMTLDYFLNQCKFDGKVECWKKNN